MPPYRLMWLEIAQRQYLDLPQDASELVEARLTQLQNDPVGPPEAVYDSGFDWSVPLGDRGFVLYAVVTEPATVIVLRLVLM